MIANSALQADNIALLRQQVRTCILSIQQNRCNAVSVYVTFRLLAALSDCLHHMTLAKHKLSYRRTDHGATAGGSS